jgi:hypothetical protein
VVANELFVNLYNGNRNGLRFIIGHELGHIRFHHVALWYQIAVAYSQVIPVLGPTLSRLREYSCDRQGAALTPQGRLVWSCWHRRYTENSVDIDELLRQGQQLHGFWVGLTQMPRSHPFTVRRRNVCTGWACSSGRHRTPSARAPSARGMRPVHEPRSDAMLRPEGPNTAVMAESVGRRRWPLAADGCLRER